MKRNVFILALCALFLQSKAQERIMVIADPHVTPQSVIDAEPDFLGGIFDYRRLFVAGRLL